MKDKYPLVSVYTCVYNGEKTLHRVFKSMKNLDYPNVEHVIINDGSSDKTEDMIMKYIAEVSFPVKYRKKENGGKHSALNVAWDIAEGEFLIQLDADDELYPHAIKFLVDAYYGIPDEIRSQYWCVHGRCVTQHEEFVGEKYPEDINAHPWQEAGLIARNCLGEKIGLQKRDYLSAFRFPDVKGVSHIKEGIVWDQINKIYGTWYTNEVVRVYYVGEGGNLTAKKTTRKQFGPATFACKWKIIREDFYGKSLKNLLLYSFGYFLSDKGYRKNNKYLQQIKRHRVFLALISPFSWGGALLYRVLKRIK